MLTINIGSIGETINKINNQLNFINILLNIERIAPHQIVLSKSAFIV